MRLLLQQFFLTTHSLRLLNKNAIIGEFCQRSILKVERGQYAQKKIISQCLNMNWWRRRWLLNGWRCFIVKR